ncbi:MAG: class I SAM-dependent rRNA methyltransferase [Chloroflexota bacterium]|nr:class I SAM-dependent rRNA methyltransferase [Chloroflexota bacterium]MDE2951456.1 class I SAM-dependent rRNA methyltransferase [Chloroflexota bacterium]
MTVAKVTIKKGREKPIRNRHPWVFSGAVSSAVNAVDGRLVTVVDHKDRFLARGYWNSKSQIQVRILSWEDEAIDDAWWRRMFSRAWGARVQNQARAGLPDNQACRIVNAENDYMPGLVIDRYGDCFVLQAQTLFIDRNKDKIANILHLHFDARHVFERSDIDLRRQEGLDPTVGALIGGPPPDSLILNEGALYHVDIVRGHKTGFYLDQRRNRQKLHDLVQSCASDSPPSLLNLFSYSGGFAIAAQRGSNLRAVNVDSSRAALELAEKNFALNEYDKRSSGASAEHIQADCFDYLRYCVGEGARFDYVVLDPPKFAGQKRQVARAARGYKDLNLKAFRIVKEGGYLMTFSCSGAVSRDLFHKIVFAALADSGRQAQIVEQISAAPDHPVALTFPEGEYLKGLLLRVY